MRYFVFLLFWVQMLPLALPAQSPALALRGGATPLTQSQFGQVYRLTNAQAAAIQCHFLKQKKSEPPLAVTSWGHLAEQLATQTPLDTFHHSAPSRPLPVGHYALVRALGESLRIELHSVYSAHAFVLDNPRAFEVRVVDSLGVTRPDALVFLEGKKAAFDAATATYKIPKRHTGGLLEVRLGEELFFRNIEEVSYASYRKRRWQHRTQSPVGRVLYRTKYRTKMGYQRLRDIGQYNRHAKFRRQNRQYRRYVRRHHIGGYVVVNQPRYLPGDTLRVRAYATDRKGRPMRRPVTFELFGYDEDKLVLTRTLQAISPGDYVLNLHLADSLELDETYEVRVSTRPPGQMARWHPTLSTEFEYEDYQLDVVTYTAQFAERQVSQHQTAQLRLVALDANGQPVPEVDARIVLRTTGISRFHAPDVWVADTLWTHRLPLEPRLETLVAIPDSIWPASDLAVEADVYLTNSAGELQRRKAYLTRMWEFPALKATVTGRRLDIFFEQKKDDTPRANDAALPTSALLRTTWPDGRVTTDSIALPYSAAVLPQVRGYEVRSGEHQVRADLGSGSVQAQTVQMGDTVRFRVLNPRLLEVNYEVWSGDELLESGTTQRDTFEWSATHHTQRAFDLKLRYLWGGEVRSGAASAPHYANLLDIALDQPTRVLPGAQVPVRIRVLDAKGRPAKGVHLTAGAINRQFGSENDHWGGLNIAEGRRRSPFRHAQFESQSKAKPSGEVSFYFLKNKKQLDSWVASLGLDSLLFYRLRTRPADSGGAWVERLDVPRDTTVQPLPQVAPWIIREAEVEPIQLIWLNRRLVYFAGAEPRPYSFWAEKGWNQLQIRTRTGQFTVDSLWLDGSQKVELALDDTLAMRSPRLRISGQAQALVVNYQARPDTLLPFEQQQLRATMLLWRSGEIASTASINYYFWESARDYFPAYNRRSPYQVIGPFQSQNIWLHNPPSQPMYFRFEPGFIHQTEQRRDRLYATDWPRRWTKLPWQTPLHFPGQAAFTGLDVLLPTIKHTPKIQLKNPWGDAAGKATLRYQLTPPTDSTLWFAVLLPAVLDTTRTLREQWYGPFAPLSSITGIVPAGTYRLLVYTKGGAVAARTVEVRRDSVHCVDFQKVIFSKPIEKNEVEVWKQLVTVEKTTQFPAQISTNQPIYSYQNAGQTVLMGKVTDEATNEELIGATVKIFKNGQLIRGVVTDVSGDFRVPVDPGTYDVEVSYTGYTAQRVVDIRALPLQIIFLEVEMVSGGLLQEVLVVAYKVPLIKQDQTSSGRTLTSDEIRSLPTRSVNAITATTSGTGVTIRGSRSGATNYYVEGVRVSGEALLNDPVALRTQFRDFAYWQPTLRTDARGEAFFGVKFPDNITAWDTYVLGMDGKKRGGITRKTTRAYKPLTAQVSLPRFAVAGDRFEAAGLVTNLDADSTLVRTRWTLDGRLLTEQTARMGAGLAEYARVDVSATADSVRLRYEVQGPRSNDGEERGIAVLPIGTTETSGDFWVLERDTQLVFQPDQNAATSVAIHAEDRLQDLLLVDIQYLASYPYGCNEQTASRLTALLLAEKIVASSTGDTRRRYEIALGNAESRRKSVVACVQRLRQTQLPDGAWGWWADGAINPWMTIYVTRALWQAQQAGHRTEAIDRATGWLRTQLPRLSAPDQLATLGLLREVGVNVDCTPYLASADSIFLQKKNGQTGYATHQAATLERLRLRQLCGLPIERDSLLRWLVPTTFGGLYCGDEDQSWYYRRSALTLQAYDLAEAAGWTDVTVRIRRYWFSTRGAGKANTFETAQVLTRLFAAMPPEALADVSTPKQLIVNGKTLAANYPATLEVPADGSLRIERKGGAGPLFLTAYQTWHNPTPAPRGDIFGVKTHWEQGRRNVHPDSLRRGEVAYLVVEVEATVTADYVMVEVPIPAACGYGTKTQPDYWRRGSQVEVHREYFRDHVSIFCERLPKGSHTFRIEVEPRFEGSFTVNPARVEQMYFPTFFGRTGVERCAVR